MASNRNISRESSENHSSDGFLAQSSGPGQESTTKNNYSGLNITRIPDTSG
jgi:hypothetical protein